MPDISDSDLVDYDAGRLIQILFERWLALLDRYDGRGTAVTDPVDRVQIYLELQSRALLLCAIPAPALDAVKPKVLVAAWARDNADTWAPTMIEEAIARDTLALQPENILAV